MARRRTVHGNLASLGRSGTTWEKTPSDEVASVPEGAAAPQAPRDAGRFTAESAREAARKRWALAGLPDFGDSAAPWLPPAPELALFDGARTDLLAQRWDEVLSMTGGVSSGVGTKLRAYAFLHAAGEFWASKFYATADPKFFEFMVRAFKAAATADDDVRDTAAWEARARPRSPADAHSALVAALSEEDRHGR
jgi:hypothetical protein